MKQMTGLYNVWITRHGGTAKTAGIIGATRHMQSYWDAQGNKKWRPGAGEVTQENYLLAASNDQSAIVELNLMYQRRHPSEKRPLSGASYIRHTRVTTEEDI